MNLEKIIEVAGQLATWITVFLVFRTLREMEKQRKAAQKPELIIPNVSIFGYSRGDDEIFIASHWSNKELRNEGFVIGKLPKITVYNIGAGAAKEIKMKWDFDIQKTIKTIQDFCYKNSIPVIVSDENEYITTDFKGNLSGVNIQAVSNVEYSYLIPASVTSQGLETDLPLTFLSLVSIFIFLKAYQTSKASSEKILNPIPESYFETPPLRFELQYADIGGNKYKKKFDINFDTFVMRYPNQESESLYNEPVFHGHFEFKERK